MVFVGLQVRASHVRVFDYPEPSNDFNYLQFYGLHIRENRGPLVPTALQGLCKN